MSTRTYLLPTGTGAYVETGANEALALLSADQVVALGMIGRKVHLTGTPHQGWVIAVDGPDWVAVQGPDPVDGRLSLVHPLNGLLRPFATVRWCPGYRPLGLNLLGVDMDDLTVGPSLVHPARV